MKRMLYVFFTLMYLKPIQIHNRILRRFKKVKFVNQEEVVLNEQLINWQTFPLVPTCYDGNGRFKFLNVVDQVTDWNDNKKSKLWIYNLHYFNDLNQCRWQERTDIHTDLIDSWIKQNPPMDGNGWEPYPISLRSVNWIKWFLSENDARPEWLSSLSLQVQALDQQLEYHLLGNHLFANAKGLVFAGCFFKGKNGEAWLKRGLAILEKEIPEQILTDGGNFELTPMYHNIILADMLDLYHLSLVYPGLIPSETQSLWYAYILKMFGWAEQMEHPDGDVSFFNDSAIGIAPKLKRLKEYAEILNVELPASNDEQVTLLKDSGYVIAQVNDKKLITDVAKVGPDYIPGHAHADTLSFELSIGNQRVFVNSGTSVYGLGEERLRQRKTETHNTVVVNGEDSSEVWSGFRVARRAYPSTPKIASNEQTVSVECSHDGYMRLPGKVIHTRTWLLASESLIVSDLLTGTFNDAKAHYHLHPDIQVLSDDGIIIQLPDNSKYGVKVEGGDAVVLDSTWHPEFGLSVANKKLLVNFKQNEVTFILERIM